MKFYNLIILAGAAGFVIAELLHRRLESRRKAEMRRLELAEEYDAKELSELMPFEEWLAANARGLK